MDDKTTKAAAAESQGARRRSQIEKQFGKGSIMRYGDNEVSHDIQVVSTGSLGLDIALGVGGLRAAAWSRSMVRNRRARPR